MDWCWCRTLAHQRQCQLRLGVVAEELEKFGLGGHLRVVSVTRVHCAKDLDGLRTDCKRHEVWMMLKADDMGATDGGTQNTTRSVQNH